MKLAEIISKTDQENLNNANYEVVDQKQIGEYGLFLIKMPKHFADMIGSAYQIALNRNEIDFTDYNKQKEKHLKKGDKVEMSRLPEFDQVITSWIAQYGTLVLSSANVKKTDFYKRFLEKRGFKIGLKVVNRQPIVTVS